MTDETVTITKRAMNRYMSMHVSVLIVLQMLEGETDKLNPSLMVVRDAVRELRRYNDGQPMPTIEPMLN